MHESTRRRGSTIFVVEGYGDYKPGLEAITRTRAGAFVSWEAQGIAVNIGTERRPQYQQTKPCWVAWSPQPTSPTGEVEQPDTKRADNGLL